MSRLLGHTVWNICPRIALSNLQSTLKIYLKNCGPYSKYPSPSQKKDTRNRSNFKPNIIGCVLCSTLLAAGFLQYRTPQLYGVSKKWWHILYGNLLHKVCHYFLYTQYLTLVMTIHDTNSTSRKKYLTLLLWRKCYRK